MEKAKNRKSEFLLFVLPWSKYIHSNPKGIIILLKQNLDVTYRPHGHVLCHKWLFLVKNGNFSISGSCGVCKSVKISIVFGVLFELIGIHFEHCNNKIRFSFFSFSHRLRRGGVWILTSMFLKVMFKRGQVEHILTMANLKLKPSLFTPRPSVHQVKTFCKIINV